jgi:RNA polymerase sigma factor (sigma-70 family)
MPPDDSQLLDDYIKNGSQAAFAELSRRYVNLVYSSALRQMRDAHAAEDVTQAVFIVLARKADSLKRDLILPSWLLQTTAYAVNNARRAEARRRHHEQKAAAMKSPIQEEEVADLWKRMEPVVDSAVRSLRAAYRDALVLRYLDGQSYQEIARRLKITEAAARQRASRGAAELREILAKQGVLAPAVTTAAMESLLQTNAVQCAPHTLASACAIAGAGTSAPLVIAKGVLTMLLVKELGLAASLALLLSMSVGVVAVAKGGAGAKAAEAPKPQHADAYRIRPPVEGRVVDADGKPLAAALVYLADPYHPVTVYGEEQAPAAWVETSGYAGQAGYDHKPSNQLLTTTDGQGRFRFEAAEIPMLNPQQEPRLALPTTRAFHPEDFAMVVASEKGFAQVMPDAFAAAGNQIAVSAWGEIEGTLLSEGKPLPNAAVRLSRMTHLWEGYPFMVQYEDQVKSDDLGHFKFAQVAPGDAWLTHSASGQQMGIGDQAAYVRVEPGKSHLVELGGKGRAVIGQLVEPANSRERAIWVDTYHHSGGTLRIEPYPLWDQPANWFEFSWESRAAKYAKWSATEAGRIHNENLFPFQVDVRPDGTFKIADVPPGKYKLSLSTYEGGRAREVLGGLSMIIQVEPVAPEKPAEPQDLGGLTMPIKERLQVGDAAPDFAVNRLDGNGQIKLSDYKGKLVVLQLWSWEFPPTAFDPKIHQRVAALAEQQKEKLAVIGIGMGSDLAEMRKTAKQTGMNWPLGITEPSSKCPNDYHVTLYGLFLIGTDGKVLGRQLSEREIVPSVERALREMH